MFRNARAVAKGDSAGLFVQIMRAVISFFPVRLRCVGLPSSRRFKVGSHRTCKGLLYRFPKHVNCMPLFRYNLLQFLFTQFPPALRAFDFSLVLLYTVRRVFQLVVQRPFL
jgi:hypothetical protein